MPLPTERWVKEIHSSLPEQEAILGQMELERQKGSVLLPKFELRMVGDLVLTKTSDASLLAIDFETGVIQWPFYFHDAPVPLTSVPFAPNGASNSLVSYELMNRLWGSSAFGRFSCDEQRFYFVSNEQPLSSERVFRAQADAEDTNYLEGASLSAQGAILWRVGGGSGGDEPRLAGAYFLGPPLPYEGELYALVEIKGETTLAVLDAATGHLRWKQQLVHANAPLLQYDAERKSQALSPTIADGVILCPTGVGAVAAVDLLSRSLRWGATYTTERANDRHGFRAQRSAFGESPNFSPLDRRWLDPAMIAQDGVVLISPPESDSMFCRDILTGQPRLEPQRRNANRYIAGLREGNIITVGERHVTATQLGTGSPLWTCEFPAGLTLAGKGLWQAESLLLPLSDRTVIRVRTADGKITDQAQVAQPLGNLFAYKNQLLSVSASSVSVYYTRDALAEQVQTALAKNPQDTWALNQQSQLAVARGELQPAIEALSKSFELEPDNADTRYLLVETLLEGLSEDFARFEGYAQQYADIVEFGPQRFRFLQQLALGKIRGGQSLAAFERLLDLIPQVGSTFAAAQNRQRGLQLAADYSVDSDTWIATELARAYQGASPAERQEMDRWIEGELAATERTMVPLRREQLRFLRWLPGAHAALQELATGLLGGEEQTTAEHLLQPLLHSPHAEQRAQAMRLLRQPTDTDFVRFAGQMEQVARAIAELERLEAYPPQNAGQTSAAELALLHPPRPWNDGMVHIDASSDGGYFYGVVVESEAERYGRPPLSIALSGSTV
ncbi:MAG: PQQ-binding-like beta-propeller repeat protein, partial [Planctomycetales bacterium]|nr:PQQ-binding-like beta-propeller repeat protein [Planctomycetales bacterium]